MKRIVGVKTPKGSFPVSQDGDSVKIDLSRRGVTDHLWVPCSQGAQGVKNFLSQALDIDPGCIKVYEE